MDDALYYEDFQVGQRFESAPATMERDRLVAFAEEFDPQPQHLSEERAAGSLFGTLVASGWHTAALVMRLQLESMMGRVPGGAMGAQVDSLAWRKPVHPGDQIRAVQEVLAMRESRTRKERGLLTLRTTALNQNGETVMEMTAAVLVPKRPIKPG